MLPAISDIARHVPDAEIDWIAEEAFAEIPAWHPAVNEVIKVAHRRWRKAWWSGQVRAERKALRERLRSKQYDIVLDMQALLKSAWLVRQARGVRHGLDWRSAREPLASLLSLIHISTIRTGSPMSSTKTDPDSPMDPACSTS